MWSVPSQPFIIKRICATISCVPQTPHFSRRCTLQLRLEVSTDCKPLFNRRSFHESSVGVFPLYWFPPSCYYSILSVSIQSSITHFQPLSTIIVRVCPPLNCIQYHLHHHHYRYSTGTVQYYNLFNLKISSLFSRCTLVVEFLCYSCWGLSLFHLVCLHLARL